MDTWYAGGHSTNGGGNAGWVFEFPPVISVANEKVYITGEGDGIWYAGVNSTDGGGNTGWLFMAPSDLWVRRLWSVRPATEVIGITDTVVKMAIKAIAETVGLTDTFVRRLWSIRISTTEVIGLTETFIRRLRSIRIINETVGIVESFIRRLWSIRISLEVESIVDRMIRAGQAIHLMVSDVIGITDSHMGVKALLTRAKVIISRLPFTRMRKDRFL
jgi:hypothetical protein